MDTEKHLKFAFFGTPEVASKTLEILYKNGYVPSIIITQPDAPSGRGLELHESPVSIWAKEHNINCLKPDKITPEFIEEFNKFNTDLSIVVAYGKILPEALIITPRLGTINIHYSLLPKYRGASPLEAALLAGDEVTGVSIQQMEFKMDTGPIIAEQGLAININDTKETLREKLIVLGSELLIKTLQTPSFILPLIKGEVPKAVGVAQNESLATYCSKIKKEDGEIDPTGDARINWNKYRAFYGWPGVFFFLDGKRIKVTHARFDNGLFIIEKVTPEGKKETTYQNLLDTLK
ncbi:MAG: methionyl-tRNA formyltransferase [bacterium]